MHDVATDATARSSRTRPAWYAQDQDGNVWLLRRGRAAWRAGEDGAEAGLAMPATRGSGDGVRPACAVPDDSARGRHHVAGSAARRRRRRSRPRRSPLTSGPRGHDASRRTRGRRPRQTEDVDAGLDRPLVRAQVLTALSQSGAVAPGCGRRRGRRGCPSRRAGSAALLAEAGLLRRCAAAPHWPRLAAAGRLLLGLARLATAAAAAAAAGRARLRCGAGWPRCCGCCGWAHAAPAGSTAAGTGPARRSPGTAAGAVRRRS